MPIRTTLPLPLLLGSPKISIDESNGKVLITEQWSDLPSSIPNEVGIISSGFGPNVALNYAPADPAACEWTGEQTARFKRKDENWDVEVKVNVRITCDRDAFHVSEQTLATLNGQIVADIVHSNDIPRVLM
jgi:hypothetical protein